MHADLDTATYPTGIKISDKAMKLLTDTGALTRHGFHGEWNYTVHPQLTHPRDTPDPD